MLSNGQIRKSAARSKGWFNLFALRRRDPAHQVLTRVPARLFLLLLNENVKTFVSRIVHAVKARSRAESYLVRPVHPGHTACWQPGWVWSNELARWTISG